MDTRKNSRGGTRALAQRRSARAVRYRSPLDAERSDDKLVSDLPRLAKDSDANEGSVQANVINQVRVLSFHEGVRENSLVVQVEPVRHLITARKCDK